MTAIERDGGPPETLPAEIGPHHGALGKMAIGALGVVYGDIGTSPLYTFKTAIEWAGGEATPAVALGILSLVVWTLIITTSLKYVAIVMRADNDGEGGRPGPDVAAGHQTWRADIRNRARRRRGGDALWRRRDYARDFRTERS